MRNELCRGPYKWKQETEALGNRWLLLGKKQSVHISRFSTWDVLKSNSFHDMSYSGSRCLGHEQRSCADFHITCVIVHHPLISVQGYNIQVHNSCQYEKKKEGCCILHEKTKACFKGAILTFFIKISYCARSFTRCKKMICPTQIHNGLLNDLSFELLVRV